MADASQILLIEDDEPLAGILSAHLRARGYDVTSAPTAEAAQTALRSGLRPDLVLLDINLPGETGWSVVRSDALVAAGDPPVVVASAMSVSPSRLREYGVAGYLPKPFALETLRSTIERLLAKESNA
jgi:DNA-binding response OmpR family regulator